MEIGEKGGKNGVKLTKNRLSPRERTTKKINFLFLLLIIFVPHLFLLNSSEISLKRININCAIVDYQRKMI